MSLVDNLLVLNNVSENISFFYDTKKSNPIHTVGSPQSIFVMGLKPLPNIITQTTIQSQEPAKENKNEQELDLLTGDNNEPEIKENNKEEEEIKSNDTKDSVSKESTQVQSQSGDVSNSHYEPFPYEKNPVCKGKL